MKIVEPSFEILTKITGRELADIEKIGRVCYKSEDKIKEGSDRRFVAMLIKNGHEAMLEHSMLSVKFVCDRGIANQIVRHRHCAFAQENSTYKRDELAFIRPSFIQEYSIMNPGWLAQMQKAEETYLWLKKCGLKDREARVVLPMSLKTELVVTTNYREWRNILKLRTANDAHPQIRDLMCSLLIRLKKLIPVVFDDIWINTGYYEARDAVNDEWTRKWDDIKESLTKLRKATGAAIGSDFFSISHPLFAQGSAPLIEKEAKNKEDKGMAVSEVKNWMEEIEGEFEDMIRNKVENDQMMMLGFLKGVLAETSGEFEEQVLRERLRETYLKVTKEMAKEL